MRSLNEQFDEYRDCLRVIWNLALRHRSNGTVAFPDVSQALLDALVLDELANATPANTARTSVTEPIGFGSVSGYIPALGVVIKNAAHPVLQPIKNENTITWNLVDIEGNSGGNILHYVDVFDFKNADEVFDFEYVKGVSSMHFDCIKKGDLILLRRSDVDIVDLS